MSTVDRLKQFWFWRWKTIGTPVMAQPKRTIRKDNLMTDDPHGNCDTCGHASDCATHNEPMFPAGPCDCEASA